jgi:2-isopropylmalate synthase
MAKDVVLYDTTLRDGEQAEGIAFSLDDKLHIAYRLDEFGMDYIEGGWPGSNPKAIEFFRRIDRSRLKHARLASFGSTRRKKIRAEDDENLRLLVASKTPTVTIFGKSWDLHVREALLASLDENLAMIRDSVRFLRAAGREVIYDAEHFFDGYKHNPAYALKTIEAAAEAGADCIVLCDTNGGSLPTEIVPIVLAARGIVDLPLGIHAHNDAGMAVANSLLAVQHGATHVQGTINGYGERSGNADLIPIMANLELKMGKRCLPKGKLRALTNLAHFVAEVANLVPDPHQPFVGRSVFAHKAGIHVSAMRRQRLTYEHVDPQSVGNATRILVSELSGQSNIHAKAEELGIEAEELDEKGKAILNTIKDLENEGYQFEAAEGSFEVLVRKALGKHKKFFDLEGFRVIVEKRGPDEESFSEATIKLLINGERTHTAADAVGPVNALDRALRKALRDRYPQLGAVHLQDFKVRVLDAKSGTAAKVRVLINSTDGEEEWATVGVSENILEASWRALMDSIEYKLLRGKKAKARRPAK